MASKKNKTFADQAKTIMSKYALRPDDNASRAAMNRELDVLKEQQEMERQRMAQEAMETLNSLGMAPQAPGMMGDQMPPQQEMMGPPPQGMPMQQAYGGKKYALGGPEDESNPLKKVEDVLYSPYVDPIGWYLRKMYEDHKSDEYDASDPMNQAMTKYAANQKSSPTKKKQNLPMIDHSGVSYGSPMRSSKAYGGVMNPYSNVINTSVDTPTDPPRTSNQASYDKSTGLWSSTNPNQANFAALQQRADYLDNRFEFGNIEQNDPKVQDTLVDLWDSAERHAPLVTTPHDWQKKYAKYMEKNPKSKLTLPEFITNENIKQASSLFKDEQGKLLDRWEQPWSAATISNLADSLFGKRKDGKSHWGAAHYEGVKKMYDGTSNWEEPVDITNSRTKNTSPMDRELNIGDVLGRGRGNFQDASTTNFKNQKNVKGKYVKYPTTHFDIVVDKGVDEKGSYYVLAGGNRANIKKGKGNTFRKNKVYYDPKTFKLKQNGSKYDYTVASRIKEEHNITNLPIEAMSTLSPDLLETTDSSDQIRQTPEILYAKMREEGFDPTTQFAYGGNMKKRYGNGGEYGEGEEEDENPFEGKLTTGDYLAGLAGAAGDIYGITHALKKPEPRRRLTAEEETLDTTPYDQALARGMAAQRDIRRSNPNAALQAQIAGTTALNTQLGAQRAAAQQAMDARNLQRRMGVDQLNLGQEELDRQAMDARAMAISEHLGGIGDTFSGMRKDAKSMGMEAQIANMLGTENYTWSKDANGNLVITPVYTTKKDEEEDQ